ncbi:MAG: CmpA/NrtA family ABC transporter substrate-binding protein [Candidatus Sumerlaeia bacterium]|nr:CmpA/NrtA family ABC transporter substrate-binding protein [Candidatus Sumerlaeia bacterium]
MAGINRRQFITGVGALAAGFYGSGCDIGTIGGSALSLIREPDDVVPLVQRSSLEKPDLVIGYVPVNDCAPFAVAYVKGFFKKYGLRVRLSREASWATSRDGVIFGRLDASPVVSGAVVNARMGAEGAIRAPLCAGMTIHRHGNAITMNKEMWESGIRPLYEYAGNIERAGGDLRRHVLALPKDKRVFAVVLSSAIYEYLIRGLFSLAGLRPNEDYRLMIIPPPQMVTNMRIGAIQAYMVAEPWNTRAVSGNEGVGFTFAHGSEIWRGHPDRLLGVMESFIENHPKTYRSLLKAMIEACKWCDAAENREELSQILSARAFTGARTEFIRPALVGDYNYGGFDQIQRRRLLPDSTIFFSMPEDIKGDPNDHSTFLWQSQAIWLMTQSKRWGQIADFPKDVEAKAAISWRTELYREVANELGISCPSTDYKMEPGSRFLDGITFDPSDPYGYLNSFQQLV